MLFLTGFLHVIFNKIFGWIFASTTYIVIYDDITPYPKLNIFKRRRLRKTSFRRRRR